MLGEAAEPRLTRTDRGFGVALRGHVHRRADEGDGAVILEHGAARCRDVAEDAVVAADHAIFNRIAAVTRRIDTGSDRRANSRPVVGMDPLFEDLLVDRRTGWQAPHGAQPVIPFERACTRVPRIDADADQFGHGT